MFKNFGLTAGRGFSTTRLVAAPKVRVPSFDFIGATQVNAVQEETEKLEKSTLKSFSIGGLYDPFDFSIAKIRLERKKNNESFGERRFFDEKKVNPLDLYTNTKYLSSYLTSTGRLLPREVTKLSLKNQKRLAKSVKRARAAGLLSSVHRDADLLTFFNDSSVRG